MEKKQEDTIIYWEEQIEYYKDQRNSKNDAVIEQHILRCEEKIKELKKLKHELDN